MPGMPTKLVRDNAYHDMAVAYQLLLIQALDETMLECGVSDASVRQAVCERFFFWHGGLHDQGWLRSKAGEVIYPLLCFSKKFLNINTPIDDIGDVFAGSEYVSWLEYSTGSVSEYFAGDPSSKVASGSVGDEELST